MPRHRVMVDVVALGIKGQAAKNKATTPEQRRRIARKAARARWKLYREQKTQENAA